MNEKKGKKEKMEKMERMERAGKAGEAGRKELGKEAQGSSDRGGPDQPRRGAEQS